MGPTETLSVGPDRLELVAKALGYEAGHEIGRLAADAGRRLPRNAEVSVAVGDGTLFLSRVG